MIKSKTQHAKDKTHSEGIAGSTRNLSHKRNGTGARLVIALRNWSRAQRILSAHGISQREVAERARVPLVTVNRALDPRWCSRTRYESVLRTRCAIRSLLHDHNVAHDPLHLFDDLDSLILEDAKR